MNVTQKRRLFLIDILRVLCALQIYMYHSGTMYGCSYGHFIDALLGYLTSPVMTCFFLLSGFSIHYQHRKEETSQEWTRRFLKKRLITIMPSYLLVALIWPLVYPFQFKDWAILLPVDLFGIQTLFRTLFGILHNGGTWFVSCMLLCYVCYPVMKAVIRSEKKRTTIIVIGTTHFLLMYSNVVIPAFMLDGLYSNPIARSAEFMVGVAFAEIVFSRELSSTKETLKGRLGGVWKPLGIILCMSVISVIIARFNHADLRTTVFGYFVIPVVLVILYVSTVVNWPFMENNKVLSILSGMSYQFFLAQLFLWNLTASVLAIIHLDGNIAKIVTSFILCMLMAFVTWRFYDRPVRKMLRKRMD